MKWKDQSWYTYVGHWSADISLTWPDWHAIDFFFLHMLHMPGRCRSVCLHLQAKRFRMIFSMAAMWFWHHSITKSKYTSRANQVKCIYCMLTVFFSTKKHTMQFFVHCASTRYSRSNLQLIVYLNHIYIYYIYQQHFPIFSPFCVCDSHERGVELHCCPFFPAS